MMRRTGVGEGRGGVVWFPEASGGSETVMFLVLGEPAMAYSRPWTGRQSACRLRRVVVVVVGVVDVLVVVVE